MKSATLEVTSRAREELVDCTSQVMALVKSSGIAEGQCFLFIEHTTAGLTINENADPDVRRDILVALRHLIPVAGWPESGAGFRHFEHNADAHLKASLMGFSAVVPVIGGRLGLGQWQAIYVAEFDGPRTRRVTVQVR